MTNAVEKVIVQVTILAGKDLAAKDRNFLGRKSTSDPYVEVWKGTNDGLSKKASGTTTTQYKTLNPQWTEKKNETFIVEFFDKECVKRPFLDLKLWDEDKFSSPDSLGSIRRTLN